MSAPVALEPRIACLCCTFLRPELLANAIACFEAFDYPKHRCEMVILDDAGQYPTEPSGENWHIVSVKTRYESLGAKRNALAELVAHDGFDALAIMDDDDAYLPWTLRAHAWALAQAPFSLPGRSFFEEANGKLALWETQGLHHASWAYSVDLWREVGGYPEINSGEDQAFKQRLVSRGIHPANPSQQFPPFFVLRWSRTWRPHLSAMGSDGYERIGLRIASAPRVDAITPTASQDWLAKARESLAVPDGEDICDWWRRKPHPCAE